MDKDLKEMFIQINKIVIFMIFVINFSALGVEWEEAGIGPTTKTTISAAPIQNIVIDISTYEELDKKYLSFLTKVIETEIFPYLPYTLRNEYKLALGKKIQFYTEKLTEIESMDSLNPQIKSNAVKTLEEYIELLNNHFLKIANIPAAPYEDILNGNIDTLIEAIKNTIETEILPLINKWHSLNQEQRDMIMNFLALCMTNLAYLDDKICPQDVMPFKTLNEHAAKLILWEVSEFLKISGWNESVINYRNYIIETLSQKIGIVNDLKFRINELFYNVESTMVKTIEQEITRIDNSIVQTQSLLINLTPEDKIAFAETQLPTLGTEIENLKTFIEDSIKNDAVQDTHLITQFLSSPEFKAIETQISILNAQVEDLRRVYNPTITAQAVPETSPVTTKQTLKTQAVPNKTGQAVTGTPSATNPASPNLSTQAVGDDKQLATQVTETTPPAITGPAESTKTGQAGATDPTVTGQAPLTTPEGPQSSTLSAQGSVFDKAESTTSSTPEALGTQKEINADLYTLKRDILEAIKNVVDTDDGIFRGSIWAIDPQAGNQAVKDFEKIFNALFSLYSIENKATSDKFNEQQYSIISVAGSIIYNIQQSESRQLQDSAKTDMVEQIFKAFDNYLARYEKHFRNSKIPEFIADLLREKLKDENAEIGEMKIKGIMGTDGPNSGYIFIRGGNNPEEINQGQVNDSEIQGSGMIKIEDLSLSVEEIAEKTGLSPETIREIKEEFKNAGIRFEKNKAYVIVEIVINGKKQIIFVPADMIVYINSTKPSEIIKEIIKQILFRRKNVTETAVNKIFLLVIILSILCISAGVGLAIFITKYELKKLHYFGPVIKKEEVLHKGLIPSYKR